MKREVKKMEQRNLYATAEEYLERLFADEVIEDLALK